MTNKEYTIYSKWLAYALRKQGFKLIRTEINPNFPQFDCWVFEDNTDSRLAIICLTEDRKRK